MSRYSTSLAFRTAIALALLSLSACSVYEYDVLKPDALSGRAATAQPLVAQLDGLEYRLQSIENRLVVKIFNQSDVPVSVLSPQSTVVDPAGQSRPVRPVTIQPGSFARIILPPIRPEFRSTSGSSLSVGASSGGGYYGGAGLRRSDFGHTDFEPTDYRLVDGGEQYWDWKGQSEARLILVYQPDGSAQPFTHRLHLKRIKVK
jgi:hypothetical protein